MDLAKIICIVSRSHKLGEWRYVLKLHAMRQSVLATDKSIFAFTIAIRKRPECLKYHLQP